MTTATLTHPTLIATRTNMQRSESPAEQPFSPLEWYEVANTLGLMRSEQAVAERLYDGKDLLEISSDLDLPLGTVNEHASQLHRKLGTHTQGDIVLLVNRTRDRLRWQHVANLRGV